MAFNSYSYILFLFVSFCVYWTLPLRLRNSFLVLASYGFYCTWHWQFGFLLFAISLFNWAYSRWVLTGSDAPGARGVVWRLSTGVGVNLVVLIYYKYWAFLLSNLAAVFGMFGKGIEFGTPSILVPLGISFFTFQGIAYLIDVTAGEKPLLRLSDFVLFKALWPQLVAGPIIRLHEIRDQLAPTRRIDTDDAAAGVQRIIFGLFKKVVLADNLAPYVDAVYSATGRLSFLDAVVGIFGFGLQIYFDFSGYSDIAIGTARLFGFRFPENFNWPYMAKSPQEFWNRWHMSLSRWIRDYIFGPLSFKYRYQPALRQVSLLTAMTICGLWHGPQWTFVLWGLYHGVLLVGNHTLFKSFFAARGRIPSLLPPAATFLLVNLGWLLFRANSLAQVGEFLTAISTFRGGLKPFILRENFVAIVFLFVSVFLVVQWVVATWREKQSLRRAKPQKPASKPLWQPFLLRPAWYVFLLTCVIVFDQEARTFVYFQF